jgi:hypothetical protein
MTLIQKVVPKSSMGYYSVNWAEFLKIKIQSYSSIITIVISIDLKQADLCVESYKMNIAIDSKGSPMIVDLPET